MASEVPRLDAVMRLIFSPTEPALDALIGTLEEQSQDQLDEELLIDLSAAYLTRAQLSDHLLDLLQALDATARGLRFAPDSPRLLFNRALSLSGIPLTDQAVLAWERYLEVDPSSGWSVEARTHLAALRTDDARVLATLAESPDRVSECQVTHLQLFVDETWKKLQEWARQHDDDPAMANLHELEMSGRCLRELGYQGLLPQGIAELSADAGNPERLAELAAAQRELAAGRDAFGRTELEQAKRHFIAAEQIFQRVSSPFTPWAGFWQAAVQVYRNDYAEAISALDRLAEPDCSCPTFLGRVYWTRGLAKIRQGLYAESLADYLLAEASFRRSSENLHLASILTLIAENRQLLGQELQAWAARREAFEILMPFPPSRRLYRLLWESGLAVTKQGLPTAAEPFFAEASQVLKKLPDSAQLLSLPSVYTQLARTRAELGRVDEALEDLDRAERAAARIQDTELRKRTQGHLDRAKAEILLRFQPDESLALLSPVIDFWKARQVQLELPAMFLARARAYEALGRHDERQHNLRLAIDSAYQARRKISDDSSRRAYASTVRELYDELARFYLETRQDPLRALAWLEAARGFSLDMPGEQTADEPSMSTREREVDTSRMPDDLRILHFHSFGHTLHGWCLSRRGTSHNALDLSAEQQTRWHRLIGSQTWTSPAGRELRGDLFAWLIAPFEAELIGARDLIFVTDPAITQLPLAALWDRRDSTFLIEKYALGLTPSTTFFLARGNQRQAENQLPLDQLRALLIGQPAGPTSAILGLSELPYALREVADVERLFAHHTLLTGSQPTRARVRAELLEHDILHFAGHAVANTTDPAKSFLVLADSDPLTADGMLFADELATWPLDRLKLVFLAACETGTARRREDEGISTLASPFLAAGVETVIATLWSVDDATVAALVPELYRQLLRGATPSEALRQAQLGLAPSVTTNDPTSLDWAALQVFSSLSQP